jgi:F-type H+-transporting ATPase subunit alpha
LQTGILVIDALVPIGRGQRELILGDRQTGKTAIAVDTILNQKDKGIICIYCAIGQKMSSLARVIAQLKKSGAMEYSIVMVASGEDTPGLNYVAPYAATSIGEYFMEKGKDVLIIYHDLTHHARTYRELSLLLRRPPAREAYPGDIFYIHSRLLERATHLKKEKGGGSLTALPIIETQAQNLSAYIPTNLISITDGQIYLSPQLFQGGLLPAVDVGKSVSRVGGKTQLTSYQEVVGSLRLTYSQFQELEIFSRFGTQLDENTIKILERGKRIREILKQNQYAPYSVMEQIVILLMVNQGLWDQVSVEDIRKKIEEIKKNLKDRFPQLEEKVMSNKKLDSDEVKTILHFVETSILKREEVQSNADA